MMLVTLLFIAVCFLAYANGANDNFKGVASLFGSRTCSYRTAVAWASVTTLAGSVTALFLAEALLRKFSGKGLVPDALVAAPQFVLAVAAGAGATVLLATRLGFPISTTHGLTGALVGAGAVAGAGELNLAQLGGAFLLPLIASPLLAVATGGLTYMAFRFARERAGVRAETCLCAGIEPLPRTKPSGAAATPVLTVAIADASVCARRYNGRVLGIQAAPLLDALHFLSAGAVCFARGLNDAPKIVALLLAASALDARFGFAATAACMVAGGVLQARRVAETMSHKITGMNAGQGFAANLSTAALVTTASVHGLPVSTTHVSVGALLGMGIVTGQAHWRPVLGVLASWVITLPCAALLAGAAYALASRA